MIVSTTHKFLEKLFDLPKRKYLFDSIKENTIIFIDEFDTQKGVILDKFAKDAAKRSIDTFEFLKAIHTGLDISSIKRYDNHKELLGFKEDLKIFYNKYNLEYNIKFDTLDEQQYFLKDTANSIVNTNRSFKFITEKNSMMNYISSSKKLLNDEINFKVLHKEAEKLINRFLGLVRVTAQEYSINRKIDLSDAIYTFLNEFLTITDIQKYTILERILKEKNKSFKKKYFQNNLEKSYTNLYNLMTIKNDTNHDTQSRFYNYTLENTPETFLYYLVEKFFVAGISATATIPTKINNFDLDFLRDKIINITEEEKQQLYSLYKEHKVKKKKYYPYFIQNLKFENIEQLKYELKKINLFIDNDQFYEYIWNQVDNTYTYQDI